MPEKEIKWLHSGLNNKNPDHDLGGVPSPFEIAIIPFNNLFDDITPEEATVSHTDFRCFYISNKYQDTDYDITLITNTGQISCTNVYVGSVVANDVQKITFTGSSPITGGYFICQLDWGPELTVYWNDSYSAMAADMQTKIKTVKYCDDVTVTASGTTFTVVFGGQLQHRRMGLIKIIQNNLVQSGTREYRVDNTGASPGTWNYQGCNIVQVHTVISRVPSLGMIHIPYPYADTVTPISASFGYMHLSYINFAGQLFNLQGVIPSIPVPFVQLSETPVPPCLGNNDEVWVDMPDPQPVNTINVLKIQEGSPINQLAQVIEKDTHTPLSWTPQPNNFHVGLVKPSEGFFIWVKRVATITYGCQDKLSISLAGQRVS